MFNYFRRKSIMATLEDIATTLAALPDAIAQKVVAALPPQATVDTAAIEAAISTGFANLTAEIKTNVEGSAPQAQPASPPADSVPTTAD